MKFQVDNFPLKFLKMPCASMMNVNSIFFLSFCLSVFLSLFLSNIY